MLNAFFKPIDRLLNLFTVIVLIRPVDAIATILSNKPTASFCRVPETKIF